MYETGHNPNFATDTPPYPNFLGIGDEWTANDWITWHKALLALYGAQLAHDKWLEAWNNQPFMSWDLSWLKYDPVFSAYVKANQLDVTNFISDAVTSTENAISNLFSAGEKLTKFIEYAVPVTIGVGLAVGLTALIIHFAHNNKPSPTLSSQPLVKGSAKGADGKFKKAA